MLITTVLIFILSLAIRWYKLPEYLFFGFEQGRDAIIIERILRYGDFVLVGPATNVEGVFHGAWYYYFLLIPYWLGGGSPLVASFFLAVVGSLVPVAVYFLGREIFRSKFWAISTSVLTVFSYEYILYSRWLSNVSPAPLFIVLSFLALWRFLKTQGRKYLILFALFASLAALFELILLPCYIFLLFLLVVFRQIKKVNFATFLLSSVVALIFFLPTIIFDLRNENIISKSIFGIAEKASSGGVGGIINAFGIYFKQLYIHLFLSLFYIKNPVVQSLVAGFGVLGLALAFRKDNKKEAIFLLSWVLMSLPIMKISPGDPQHYIGLGLSFIFLFVFALKQVAAGRYFKFLFPAFCLLFLLSIFNTFVSLSTNQDVFFRTTQRDLVYSDQLALLKFIDEDSQGKPYRFISFTVPSLRPEGWQYLHSYYYQNASSEGARTVYLSIEEGVYPVWEGRWISELGKSRLESERKFGLIRLQKRILE
jgi:hypothetical protein